ncbi:MAG: phenylalanine--tRNA ligase subunit beta [Eubacteriales bacterium]|nr:phenylalanine--tRNA ligase subunit beta [Eubacteriales bacterium]
MQISYKWLLEQVPYQGSIEDFCETLSLTGTKVEAVEEAFAEISGVVVGQILAIEAHPNADRLKLCELDLGDQRLQLITAATNVEVGQKVPVATVGASLAGGLKIKRSKMRGIESAGMLCSIAELALSPADFPEAEEDGIFILPAAAPLGQDVLDYLDLRDYYIEFEITPNRPDCLSLAGLAREAAVSFKLDLKAEDYSLDKVLSPGAKDSASELEIKLEDSSDCPRYSGWIIDDVKIEASPAWMRKRLRASGIRPINNLVDITNYVMLTCGNPLHAFDYSIIEGGEVNVRRARPGEKIRTLDGVERQLSPEELIIADSKKPLAVAGVMGGEESEITADTKTVFLEVASFKPELVRKASRKLDLRSDSSLRFERGVDPQALIKARNLALKLIVELGAGKPRAAGILVGEDFPPRREIDFEPEAINAILGLEVDESKMLDILERLGFEIVAELGQRSLKVPSWRADVEAAADLAEEVARFVGYNSITPRLNSGRVKAAVRKSLAQQREAVIREIVLAAGAFEAMSSPFASAQDFADLNLGEEALAQAVKIINPLGKEREYLAQSMLPRLLEHLEVNQREKEAEIFFFELARSFKSEDQTRGLPLEEKTLSLILYREAEKGSETFFFLKGILEQIEAAMHCSEWTYSPVEKPYYQPGQAAEIRVKGELLGSLARVHPELLEKKDVKGPVLFAELNLSRIFELEEQEFKFVKPSRFPASERDLAIVAPRSFPAVEILKLIKEHGGQELSEVELFDHYEGERIEKGLKSLAYSLSFRSKSATMKDSDIDRRIAKIVEALEAKGLHLRE